MSWAMRLLEPTEIMRPAITLMPRNAVPVPRSRDGINDGNVYPTEQG